MVRHQLGFAPVVVGPGTKTGMPIHYDNPKEVGADRIANAVAAYDLYGGPTRGRRLSAPATTST